MTKIANVGSYLTQKPFKMLGTEFKPSVAWHQRSFDVWLVLIFSPLVLFMSVLIILRV